MVSFFSQQGVEVFSAGMTGVDVVVLGNIADGGARLSLAEKKVQ